MVKIICLYSLVSSILVLEMAKISFSFILLKRICLQELHPLVSYMHNAFCASLTFKVGNISSNTGSSIVVTVSVRIPNVGADPRLSIITNHMLHMRCSHKRLNNHDEMTNGVTATSYVPLLAYQDIKPGVGKSPHERLC